MKFLVLSDIHGHDEYLEKLDAEFAAADAVIFAGDFAEIRMGEGGKPCIDAEKAVPILEKLVDKSKALYAVLGNCDEGAFIEELEKRDVCVQGAMVFRDGLAFAGSGGASKFTGATPNERSEEELLSDLHMVGDRSAEYEDYADADGTAGADESSAAAGGKAPAEDSSIEWNNLIVVSHNPPHNTKVDTISAGAHVGSAAYRRFLETYQPLLSVSGHIHESVAVDKLGKTTLVNPGALAEGRYAVVNVQKQKGAWSVVKAELKRV